MKLAATGHRRLEKMWVFSMAGFLVLCLALPAGVRATPRDPALAPPLEELDARAERWQQRRRTGALVLWGSLVVSSALIGWARHRARKARLDQGLPSDPVDKSPPGPPR